MNEFHTHMLRLYATTISGMHAVSASALAAMAVMATNTGRRFTARDIAHALNLGELGVSKIIKRLDDAGLTADGRLTEDGMIAMGLAPFPPDAPTVHIPLPRAEVIRRSVERPIGRQACPLPPPAPTTGPPPALADDEDVPM